MIETTTAITPVMLRPTVEGNITSFAFLLRADLLLMVFYNITYHHIEIANVQSFSGRHSSKHVQQEILQEPNISSCIIVHDRASLHLHLPHCVVQGDSDIVGVVLSWSIQFEEYNSVHIGITRINFASDVIAVDFDISCSCCCGSFQD